MLTIPLLPPLRKIESLALRTSRAGRLLYGAARVPAGIDRLEHRESARVRLLDPAHERRADRLLCAHSRVGARRVAVPDVDRGSLDRLAGRGVEDCCP